MKISSNTIWVMEMILGIVTGCSSFFVFHNSALIILGITNFMICMSLGLDLK